MQRMKLLIRVVYQAVGSSLQWSQYRLEDIGVELIRYALQDHFVERYVVMAYLDATKDVHDAVNGLNAFAREEKKLRVEFVKLNGLVEKFRLEFGQYQTETPEILACAMQNSQRALEQNAQGVADLFAILKVAKPR